ncbi:nucleotidyltransferase domain-containing protein [Nocardia sp. NPDC058499]|uniref:nucleotidyltransferase domain-containing protein n=1 Tax=Nocardia sp. NPDC058499 TaxID=3346530 RepID=UPI00364F4DF1
MTGRSLSAEECDRRWRGWTPAEAAGQLSSAPPCWYVTGGWALDLFVGGLGREHSDLEIGVPSSRFADIANALPGYEWDVVGDGYIWPFPEEADDQHQTWLRDPATGLYHLDVFREPHRGDTWVCRRDTSITLPYDELILHTADGIPYVIPEAVLVFKAKARRAKDETDFLRALPAMDRFRQSRLSEWLARVHPGHPWLETLSAHSS